MTSFKDKACRPELCLRMGTVYHSVWNFRQSELPLLGSSPSPKSPKSPSKSRRPAQTSSSPTAPSPNTKMPRLENRFGTCRLFILLLGGLAVLFLAKRPTDFKRCSCNSWGLYWSFCASSNDKAHSAQIVLWTDLLAIICDLRYLSLQPKSPKSASQTLSALKEASHASFWARYIKCRKGCRSWFWSFRGLSNKGLAKRGTATSAFNNIRLTNRILLPQPLRLSGYSQCQHLKTDEQLSSFIKSGSL